MKIVLLVLIYLCGIENMKTKVKSRSKVKFDTGSLTKYQFNSGVPDDGAKPPDDKNGDDLTKAEKSDA